uniref:Uncharacterized protein n=1 Tax=Eutreptiella gymnastica TaxID=73025 RepID=A0A7S4GFS1_9EUGL
MPAACPPLESLQHYGLTCGAFEPVVGPFVLNSGHIHPPMQELWHGAGELHSRSLETPSTLAKPPQPSAESLSPRTLEPPSLTLNPQILLSPPQPSRTILSLFEPPQHPVLPPLKHPPGLSAPRTPHSWPSLSWVPFSEGAMSMSITSPMDCSPGPMCPPEI